MNTLYEEQTCFFRYPWPLLEIILNIGLSGCIIFLLGWTSKNARESYSEKYN